MNYPVAALLDQIVDAGLPHATERVATRLLTMTEWTPSGHGHLTLSWADYGALSNRTSRESTRRHLTALVKAGLIHYSTHDDVIHVTWYGVAGAPHAVDANTSRGGRIHTGERVDEPASDHGDPHAVSPPSTCGGSPSVYDGPGARPRCAGPPSSHTRDDGGGGSETLCSSPEFDPTTTNHSPEVGDWLRALGLRPHTVRIHTELSADDVWRIIEAWKTDAAENDGKRSVGTGALIYRLREGITPVDMDAVKEHGKYDIPPEYADILIG